MNSEDGYHIANRMLEAADKANDAANRMEEVLRQFRFLVDSGYGNNFERMLQKLESLENTNKDDGSGGFCNKN